MHTEMNADKKNENVTFLTVVSLFNTLVCDQALVLVCS